MTLLLSTFLLFTVDSTPKHGDVVLFVGDSITQAGDYVSDVEAYLLACRPSDFFRVVNVGKSSETVSGTSEPDHHPLRPCIHDRFARDVAAFKPDVVVACYGMNDGNYFPFEEERFGKFKAGMTRFIERVFTETPARALVLLTPPAFDASKAPPPPEDGRNFGYKHPAKDYDRTLRKYSDWLLTLKSDRVAVVDVHRAFNVYLHENRQGGSRPVLSPDSVHPNGNGHWLIAQSLLSEWRIRPRWKDLTLDVARPRASLAWEVVPVGQGFELWTWKTPPVDSPLIGLSPRSRSLPLMVERGLTAEELFDQRIRIVGLPEGRYDVFAFGGVLYGLDAERLRDGVGLIDRQPLVRNSLVDYWIRGNGRALAAMATPNIRDRVAKRRKQISSAWLAAQKDKPFDDLKLSIDAVSKAEDDAWDLTREIDAARQPRQFEILITPIQRS